MGGVQVFRAGAEHASLVGRLLFDFNREFGSLQPAAAEFAGRFVSLLIRDDVLVLVAGDPQEPTGFAYLTFRPTPYWDGPLAQLEELYVIPPLRGGGIGSALMAGALAVARERGVAEMHINVDEDDLEARHFYERLGFVNIEPGGEHRMLCYIGELRPLRR